MIAHENSADLMTHENRITLALTSEATGKFVDRLLSAGSEWSASRRPRHARVCSPERDRSPPAAALTCDQRFAFPWSLTLRMCCGAGQSAVRRGPCADVSHPAFCELSDLAQRPRLVSTAPCRSGRGTRVWLACRDYSQSRIGYWQKSDRQLGISRLGKSHK